MEYDSVVEAAINKLQPCMEQKALENEVDARWIVIKALEKDEIAKQFLTENFTKIYRKK